MFDSRRFELARWRAFQHDVRTFDESAKYLAVGRHFEVQRDAWEAIGRGKLLTRIDDGDFVAREGSHRRQGLGDVDRAHDDHAKRWVEWLVEHLGGALGVCCNAGVEPQRPLDIGAFGVGLAITRTEQTLVARTFA